MGDEEGGGGDGSEEVERPAVGLAEEGAVLHEEAAEERAEDDAEPRVAEPREHLRRRLPALRERRLCVVDGRRPREPESDAMEDLEREQPPHRRRREARVPVDAAGVRGEREHEHQVVAERAEQARAVVEDRQLDDDVAAHRVAAEARRRQELVRRVHEEEALDQRHQHADARHLRQKEEHARRQQHAPQARRRAARRRRRRRVGGALLLLEVEAGVVGAQLHLGARARWQHGGDQHELDGGEAAE